MTPEEALKYFDVTPWNEGEAYKTAIEALKKQIPAKMDELQSDLWICPACAKQIYGVKGVYCHNCGQALEWRADDG